MFPLVTKPGIKRDGTVFDGDFFTDGLRCRFQRGRPRKMGGERSMSEQLVGPIRNMFTHSAAGNNRFFCGASTTLQYVDATADGIGSGVTDITPLLTNGFIPSNYNNWQFAELFDAVSLKSRILAHAAPNLLTIDSTENRKTWFGDIDDNDRLVDSTAPEVSGGVCVAAPYAFVYGNSGYIAWCVPNTPNDWLGSGSGEARITRAKIVYASAVRGGAGQSPALLILSLDSVLRATFSGGAAVFDFDTISSQSSVLSSSGVIEYDGIFFWAGVDRFLMYNGVVQELPNDMNVNWFFEGLNWNQRQKVWATKVPRFGEIWWFYPRGDSVECNAAIIFNIKHQTWYDTAIDRTAGFYPQVFRYPVWADVATSPVQLVRPLNGTPASSAGGVAANAFDDNPATACTQSAPNGDISYDFGEGATQTIINVGFRPNSTQTLDLVFEVSDANFANWEEIAAPDADEYLVSTNYYFPLNAPVTGRGFRVRERGGATLTMQEVYFRGPGHMVMQQEFGYDRIVNGQPTAIKSYIEGADISYMAQGPLGDRWLGVDRWVNLQRVEQDMVQVGDMTLTIRGRSYARGEETDTVITFSPGTTHSDTSEQRRQMRLRWTSNTQGGFYEMGQTTLFLRQGDASQ